MLEGGNPVTLRNNSNPNPSKERRRSFIVEVNITLEDGKREFMELGQWLGFELSKG